MRFEPIGVIHTPFAQPADMPIQPSGAQGVAGQIVLLPELVAGLKDLDGFSHLIVLYHFHRVTRSELVVTPFLDTVERGVFATRAPTRPNPIGLSVLKLVGVHDNVLEVENVDMLDDTPLLDLKPYVPDFDSVVTAKTGWLAQHGQQAASLRSDHRFS